MSSKKSILFVNPDYHCSFAYRDAFRKLGWAAEIFVPQSYPRNLLYDEENILQAPVFSEKWGLFQKLINRISSILYWLTIFYKFKYHVYYGTPPAVDFGEKKFGLQIILGKSFELELFLSRLCGVKLITVPSGCSGYEYKEIFGKLDNGNVCGNCGFFDNCSSKNVSLNIHKLRRYFDLIILVDPMDTTEFGLPILKYKSIDLNSWTPRLKIPEKYKLPKTKNLRILHSEYLSKSGRLSNKKNIKGSPYVRKAVERLRKEGFPVELIYISKEKSRNMKYFQVQADIIVEQLIYGWWGSTFVETSALGKPVICYLRKSWKENFLKIFPEFKSIPIIEANTATIYNRLKDLLKSEKMREEYGANSRDFAEKFFDPTKNTAALIEHLERL